MTAAVGMQSDVDKFIRDQKQKLQEERQNLNGESSGRRARWDRSTDNAYVEQARPGGRKILQNGSPRKGGALPQPPKPPPQIDFEEWEKEFQEDKRKSYNEYLQNQNRPHLKKEPTPPQSGMKFGGFEEYRKKTDADRKKQYREDLEKQQREQRFLKGLRDHPNKQIGTQRETEQTSVSLEEAQQAEYERMLAGKNRQRQQVQRPRPPPSPEFSDPGMQAYADQIRRNQAGPAIRDIPTRPEDIEQLQREQQRQDQLRRQVEEMDSIRQQERPSQYPGEDYRDEVYYPPDPQPYEADRAPDLQQQPQGHPKQAWQWDIEKEGISLPLSPHEGRRKQLSDEKRRDYNEMMARKKQEQQRRTRFAPKDDPVAERLPPRPERPAARVEKPPAQEDRTRANVESKRPETPGGLLNKLGRSQQKKTDQLNEERNKEYNELMAQTAPKTQPRTAAPQDNYGGALIPGLGATDENEMRKKKTLNDEYNKRQSQGNTRAGNRKPPLPRDKHGRHPVNRYDSDSEDEDLMDKEDTGALASLPGLRYSGSAERRNKEEQRNFEYNEMIRQQNAKGKRRGKSLPDEPPQTRIGWQTPNYDQMLDQKRLEEANYRKQDPTYDGGMGRRYASEGSIDQVGIAERRLKELDREYNDRKSKFRDERVRTRRGVLEDDDWLARPMESTARDEEYQDLVNRLQGKDPISDSELEENPRYVRKQKVATRPKSDNVRPAPKNMAPPQDGYYATLAIGMRDARGNPETNSAKRRRQAKYGEDLKEQMVDTRARKYREKNEQMMVNASGYLDPEKNNSRMANLGEPQVTPRPRIRDPEVKPYHSKIVAAGNSPRRGNIGATNYDILDFGGSKAGTDLLGMQDRGRPARRPRIDLGPGESHTLEAGFDQSLLQPRRVPNSLAMPVGLEYRPTFTEMDPTTGMPSTYITSEGGGPGVSNLSLDDAYRYYGMRNPLDPDPAVFGPAATTEVPRLNFAEEPRGRRSPTRVTFEEPLSSRRRDRSRERISPYQFGEDENRSKSRLEKEQYRLELEQQKRELEEKKRRQKEEEARYEKKLDEEIRNYNPYGRGGGGAPIRDAKGNPIADLRQMRNVNEGYSPRYQSARESPTLLKDDLRPPPPPQENASGEKTHARGGHGFFGNPLTDAEKIKGDTYRDELRNQINEKRRLKQIEQEREKIEEEKELRRLEEQRKKIQQEYEEEQRKKREKEEEGRRKQEELLRKNEEKRREAERLKREKAEQRQRDREKERQEEEQFNRPTQYRSSSPPVPAARSKMATTDGVPERYPPEPITRAESNLVSEQLQAMKKLLENEKKRVEDALEVQRREPEIFDPRLVQRPPPKEVDVFERAKQGNASVPQRTSDNANPKNVAEFNAFKHDGDTESRRAFRSMFPDNPVTNATLETQQDAMLKQQEEALKTLKNKMWRDDFTSPPADILILDTGHIPPQDLGARQGTGTPKSMLKSNTAFIDVDGVNHFPEDFDDMPKRNDSARLRRRERVTPLMDGPSTSMGSVTSLDVDKLQRKNDARLRRLHQMNADEVSMADPDEILENFMAKQRYNRPPSGQTLQDDSWLRPGSKQY